MADIRTLGSAGEISLGPAHAGERVTVAEGEPGVWVMRAADEVPRSEAWLHEPAVAASLDRCLSWLAENPPTATALEALRRRIEA